MPKEKATAGEPGTISKCERKTHAFGCPAAYNPTTDISYRLGNHSACPKGYADESSALIFGIWLNSNPAGSESRRPRLRGFRRAVEKRAGRSPRGTRSNQQLAVDGHPRRGPFVGRFGDGLVRPAIEETSQQIRRGQGDVEEITVERDIISLYCYSGGHSHVRSSRMGGASGGILSSGTDLTSSCNLTASCAAPGMAEISAPGGQTTCRVR